MIVGYAEWVEEQKDVLNRLSKGAKISELAKEYGVSQCVMSAHVDKLIKMQDLLKENELYRSMVQSEVEVDAKQAKRIINGFKRCNVTTIEGVRGMSREQILNIRNFGARVVDIIEDLGWIKRDKTKTKPSVGATTSLLSGEPCSWKQRCEELERVIFKRYVLQNEVNHIDEFLFHKLEPAIVSREIKEEKEDGT